MKNTKHTKTANTPAPVAVLNTATAPAQTAEKITADNIAIIAERVALRALKTVYAKSGESTMRELYNGLVIDLKKTNAPRDIEKYLKELDSIYTAYEKGLAKLKAGKISIKKFNNGAKMLKRARRNVCDKLDSLIGGYDMGLFSDGYDVADVATLFLFPYIGKEFDAPANNGEKDKDGNGITIKRAVFRAVNRYIMGNRSRQFKTAYIDDLKGGALAVPFKWDIDSIFDYDSINAIIVKMNLTARQAQILTARLRGDSVHKIAESLGVSRQAIIKTKSQIIAKAESIGLTLENYKTKINGGRVERDKAKDKHSGQIYAYINGAYKWVTPAERKAYLNSLQPRKARPAVKTFDESAVMDFAQITACNTDKLILNGLLAR